MDIKSVGRAWVLGDNVDSGTVLATRFISKTDNSDLGNYCLIDYRPDFTEKAAATDILVAGKNFGCGSSREHAPFSIKKRVYCVVAESYARTFYRNAVNLALPLIELPGATEKIREGDVVEVDLINGNITNKTLGKVYAFRPFPDFIQGIYEAGGLFSYIQNRISAERKP